MNEEIPSTFVLTDDGLTFDLRTVVGKREYAIYLEKKAEVDPNSLTLARRISDEAMIKSDQQPLTGSGVITPTQLKDRLKSSIQTGNQGGDQNQSMRPVENSITNREVAKKKK